MGLKKPFRARTVPCNYILFGRQQTTGLPLFGEEYRMEEVMCRAECSQGSDAGSESSRQKEEQECDAAQLTQISADSLGAVSMSCFKTQLVLPMSQWPASQMIQLTSTESIIFLQPLGELFLSFFLLWDLQRRGKNSWVWERALSVWRATYPLGIWNYTRSEAPQSSEVPSFPWVYFWSSISNLRINEQKHS